MNNVEDILKQIGAENKNTGMNIFISSYWYLNIDEVHYMFKKSTLDKWEIETVTENGNGEMSFETYKLNDDSSLLKYIQIEFKQLLRDIKINNILN